MSSLRCGALALVLVATLAAGCAAPEPVQNLPPETSAPPNVELSLEVAPPTAGPGDTVVAEATVTNHGPGPIRHLVGCDPEDPGISIQLYAPDHLPILTRPTAPRCADAPVATLAEGDSVRANLTFDGRIQRDGTFEAARPGTYTVAASFAWWTDGDTTTQEDEFALATFVWEAEESAGAEPRLVLRVSPSDAPGVAAVATVENTGEASVWYGADCPVVFEAHVDGEPVHETTCESYGEATRLAPGETLEARLAADDRPEEADTIVARFQYWRTAEANGVPEAVATSTVLE